MKSRIFVFIGYLFASSLVYCETSFEQVELLYREEKYKEVIDVCGDSANISDIRILKVLGASYLKAGDYAKAEVSFHRLFNEGDEESLTGLAFAKVKSKDVEWLTKNERVLLSHLKDNVDLMRVFVLWTLELKNVGPLEKALAIVDDKTIMSDPKVNETVLKGYRILLMTAIEGAKK